MCGICGFSQPGAAVDRARFEEMTDLIAYRGPDGRGTYYDGGLALGHRRLAIVDLSPAGAQPFCYKDLVVTYNGEIYNYPELRQQLAAQGYTFTTHCDTEVLAAAYHCYGEDCVAHFNGMWAFCIYDKARGRLFCSRDRFGIKPFYYTATPENGSFAFASEIKQLLLWQTEAPTACEAALLRFLALGEMDDGANTLFEGIYQLLPGHNLLYDLASRQYAIQPYFDLNAPQDDSLGYDEACQQYRQAFVQAVALRLRADVNVGSCLSGGIDSSAIVGVIHHLLRQEGKAELQHTVSSCFDEAAYNEQAYIDNVLRDTGAVSHKVFPQIGQDTTWLDTLIWHLDEPLPSSSPYSQWKVFEEARRQNLTVMLDGQGADEQVAGYAQFHLVYFVELLRQGQRALFKRELAAYTRLRSAYQPVSPRMVKLFCYSAAYLPRRLARFVNGLFIRWRKPRVFSQPGWRQLLLASPQYDVPSTRAYIRHNISGHLRLLLHLEDRNSMAHSVESRVPFMDHNLAQLSWKLPFGYKIRDGVSKAVLRDGLRDFLPPEVYARQNKMGFATPEAGFMQQNREWFRAQLAAACRRFPRLLDEKTVLEGFDTFLAQPQTGEFVWWRIMCTARWAEVFGVAGTTQKAGDA